MSYQKNWQESQKMNFYPDEGDGQDDYDQFFAVRSALIRSARNSPNFSQIPTKRWNNSNWQRWSHITRACVCACGWLERERKRERENDKVRKVVRCLGLHNVLDWLARSERIVIRSFVINYRQNISLWLGFQPGFITNEPLDLMEKCIQWRWPLLGAVVEAQWLAPDCQSENLKVMGSNPTWCRAFFSLSSK